MSMTLHRLDRGEIIAEFRWIVDRFKDERPKRSSVVSIGRAGRKSSVVKVVENGRGTFLCLLDEGNPVASLAGFMRGDAHKLDFPELLARLERCSGADVWLQWPDDDPRTVVGKILAVLAGDTLVVGLMVTPDLFELDAAHCGHIEGAHFHVPMRFFCTVQPTDRIAQKIPRYRELQMKPASLAEGRF